MAPGWVAIFDMELRMTNQNLKDENDKLRGLLIELLTQLGELDRGDGNAPGHAHEIPGVWDSAYGVPAGKPCAWCALWAEAKETILTHNAPHDGRRACLPAERPFDAVVVRQNDSE